MFANVLPVFKIISSNCLVPKAGLATAVEYFNEGTLHSDYSKSVTAIHN
jgi:hypothetical protein